MSYKNTVLQNLRIAVSTRETGLKRMRARHARETMRKEQELQAARAALRLAEQEAGLEPTEFKPGLKGWTFPVYIDTDSITKDQS